MTPSQGRNVVALLQREPLYYRNFGLYWWHVKRELKRMGYGPEQLYMLGDYFDPLAETVYAGLSVEELDNQAFETQYAAAIIARNRDTHFSAELGPYVIRDGDAE